MVNHFAYAIFLFGIITLSLQESINLPDLDPQDAQQIIEQQDTSLKYAPKVESNVPAVRYLGNEPHNVVEDIYLANQYHGQDGLGGYLYGYSVPDIAKTEKKKAGGDLRGAYNYIAGNGQEIKVEYWDDGTGFHQIDNVPKNLPEDLPAVKAEKERFLKRWQEEAERNSRPVEDPYNSEGQYKEGPLSLQGQLHRQQQFAAQFGKSTPYKQPEGAASQQSAIYSSNLEKSSQPYTSNYQPYQGKDQQNQGVYQSKQTHSSYTKGPQATGYGQSSGGYGSQSSGGYGSSGSGGYGSQSSGGYGQTQTAYGQTQTAYGGQGTAYGGQGGKASGGSGYGGQSSGGKSGYGAQKSVTSGYGSTTAYGGPSTSAPSGYGGSGGYSKQPAGGAYGGQSTSVPRGYGGSAGYNNQASSGAYGGQSTIAPSGYGGSVGYGNQAASGAYGGQSTSGYGAKPSGGASGYGAQSSSSYGNTGGYSNQPSTGAYGGQPNSGYGAKPASGYVGQSAGYGGSGGYGSQAPSTGYGGQSSTGYGQSSGGYVGQSSQNVNKYASIQSSSYGQGSESHSKYISNQGQEDDGSYKPEKDEEQGPPRGFFYKFDYPVGIIVSKQGPAQGGSYGQGGYQENKPGSY